MGDQSNEQFDGPVTALAKVIKHVLSAAAEAEMMASHMDTRNRVSLMRLCSEESGHHQTITKIKTGDKTEQEAKAWSEN